MLKRFSVDYKPNLKLKCYHGTYPTHLESIFHLGFQESINDKWFGNAVYFFIHGISTNTPAECAEQYAKDSAWSTELKKNQHNEYVVLETDVKVNEKKLLDLTMDEGQKLFNEYRQQYVNAIEANSIRTNKRVHDVHLLDTMRKNLGIEFVKANTYIKFGIQRRFDIKSRIPNVTIFAVNNPEKNIIKATIKVIKRGVIS